MPEYVLAFADSNRSFRLAELDAIATLFNISIGFEDVDLSIPFLKVELASEREARLIGSRSLLIKNIWECWADADDYSTLHDSLRTLTNIHAQYKQDTSFRVSVTAHNHRNTAVEVVDKINSLSYLDFKGLIDMKNPQLELGILEYYLYEAKSAVPIQPQHIWVGRKICDGQRHLIDKYNVKKRLHIGNTSMEAEVSLLMVNQAQVQRGSLVYDPFAGTGSMLYVCAEFGATVIGSDIDGRHMRGKNGKSIASTLADYGHKSSLLDCMTFDLAQNPWRVDGFLDAIITDPPYGVRAGAKRLGRKDISKLRMEPVLLTSGEYAHLQADYIPPSQPWEIGEVLDELLDFSARMLKPGGRLVYWLPTVTEEYQDEDIPKHSLMKLVANSHQDFAHWSRHLITMERLPVPNAESNPTRRSVDRQPGHHQFRERYFAGFLPTGQ